MNRRYDATGHYPAAQALSDLDSSWGALTALTRFAAWSRDHDALAGGALLVGGALVLLLCAL